MARHGFPDGFVWGAATSAQQIEGARDQGGRGESIWDRFERVPEAIADGSNSATACDHYHRWGEDVEWMGWLGLDAYRFSISWPRILPRGRGEVNRAGLDFYDQLVDGLLAAGIQPFPTLYHWDLPQALQESGGWADRATAEAFADYTEAVVHRLGDRVQHWVTHNEPWCAATLGYEEGHHAPGHKNPAEALAAAHHILLSHGWATQRIRQLQSDAEVGIVLIHCPAHAASDSEADLNAARWFDGFFNRWYLDPLLRGSYPEDAIADRVAFGHLADHSLPFVEEGDLETISTPLDFLGINYYSRTVMRAGADGRPEAIQLVAADELTRMGWEVYPDGLHESLLRVHREYAPPKIYVAENGSAYDDPEPLNGRIADTARAEYLRNHLLAVRRAVNEGIPVAGYFVWSLLDNFEWGYGYAMRFGILSVDFESQLRTPKDSAHLYRAVIAANAVDPAPIQTP